jgi:hypothetical protein
VDIDDQRESDVWMDIRRGSLCFTVLCRLSSLQMIYRGSPIKMEISSITNQGFSFSFLVNEREDPAYFPLIKYCYPSLILYKLTRDVCFKCYFFSCLDHYH